MIQYLIKYRIIRYKYDKILEMLNYKHLDYLQQKYYTQELCKIYNPNIKKSIRLLELLTNNNIIDNSKYDIMGYCVENNTTEDIILRHRDINVVIQPGKQMYIKYNEDTNLDINSNYEDIYLEQLSYEERQQLIDHDDYISFKDSIAKEILRENDYNTITCCKN